MSREDLHFRLRIPHDLKAEIDAAARSNMRSMTAEIVARLAGAGAEQRTLRDWFAGQALTGLLAHASGEAPTKAPALAYALADAMMAERSKP